MTDRVALPMYDWPEERAAVDAFWTQLRLESGLNLPEALERPRDEAALLALWRDPALVFAQCCWGPISLGLVPGLRVLAQPDYSDVPGGRGALYRSALVAREGQVAALPDGPGAAIPPVARRVDRLAVNARHSMSGWLAFVADSERDLGARPDAREIIETGGHRESIRVVAQGRADLAAIDCRAWALALRHEPCARALRVIGWTAERPGLPFVTGAGTDDKTAARLRETLIGMGAHPPQERDA